MQAAAGGEELPAVFAEFHRTLAPGGYLMLGIHVGDERLHEHQAYGHPVSYDSYLLPPDRRRGPGGRAGRRTACGTSVHHPRRLRHPRLR